MQKLFLQIKENNEMPLLGHFPLIKCPILIFTLHKMCVFFILLGFCFANNVDYIFKS